MSVHLINYMKTRYAIIMEFFTMDNHQWPFNEAVDFSPVIQSNESDDKCQGFEIRRKRLPTSY